ncbi:MAG TPA: signal peptidase I [Gemmatimonadaceae bacterium]
MAKTAKKPAAKPKNVVAEARTGGTKSSQPLGKWLWENFKSLAGAVVIYLFVKTLFVEAFRIPSGSMIPTLLVGDWLFVNKLAYGPTIPFTNSHLPGYTNPKHNDVVVFVSPPQPDEARDGRDPTPTLVKRLIGMPGDTLYMRDGLLHRNGVPQPQGPEAAHNPKLDPNSVDPLFTWQHTVEIKNSRFGPPPAQPTHDNWGPLVVPADHYFMMGDNRYCSKDSRFWGVVPKQNVRGRPLFVYYSYVPGPDPADNECSGQISDRPVPFITNIRWGRIGHVIR